MINQTVKNAVYQKMLKEKFNSNEEKIFCSCIIYKIVTNFILNNSQQKSNINSTINSFYKQIIVKIQNSRKNFISYSLMRSEVQKIGKDSFFNYNINEIEKVYSKYLIKNRIAEFNAYYFDPAMYLLINLSHKDYLYTEKCHFNIMAPIFNYFKNMYGITEKDITIYSALEIPDLPCKKIKFKINYIHPVLIQQLISSQNINVDIIDCEIDGDYIIIKTK